MVRTRDGGGKVRSTKGGACEERARERVMGQGGVAVGLCGNRHRVHQQRTRPTHAPAQGGGRETVMMRGCVGCFATTTIHTHTDGDRESMYIYIYEKDAKAEEKGARPHVCATARSSFVC